jgi:hypothetical protein
MSADAVAGAALAAGRDYIAGDVKAGGLDLHYRIELFNDDGELVFVLPFADALEVVGPR